MTRHALNILSSWGYKILKAFLAIFQHYVWKGSKTLVTRAKLENAKEQTGNIGTKHTNPSIYNVEK